MSEVLTLPDLQREAYDIAVARGQWPRGCRATVAVPSVLATVARRAFGEEATELAAALSRLSASAPLDPVADELADVVIVCASIAEALGVDLEQAVRAKLRVNAARAKRHREEGDDASESLAGEEGVDGVTHFALYHPDLNVWECQAEGCRFLWEFENGNPYEHHMRFCPRCGRRIVREAQHLAGRG